MHLILGPEVTLHTVEPTPEVRALVGRDAAYAYHAVESGRPDGLTSGESVADVVACRGKDSHPRLVCGVDRMSPATCRVAAHADRDSPAPRCDRVLDTLGHRAGGEMDHGISDTDRHHLGVRRAAQEVVERWLTLRTHAPSGQQRLRRGAMTGVVAEARCTRVGRIQVIVAEVMLELEHELKRQRGMGGIEACVEDADAHAITAWSPDELPRGRKLREFIAQMPGELLAGRPVRARGARFTDPAAESEHLA